MTKFLFSTNETTQLFLGLDTPHINLRHYDKIVIIIDYYVHEFHWDYIKNNFLKDSPVFKKILLSSIEDNKSMKTVLEIIEELNDFAVTKNSLILSIGGGIIGDIVGFLSAIYLRGVSHITIPTTVISMADSCFGGKNGINASNGKNMIGTIKVPNAIVIDTRFLVTLDNRSFNSGIAEIIKYGAIYDPLIILDLIENPKKYYQRDISYLSQLIIKSLNIKYHFIKNDLNDRRKRRILNFGHSFGHAIESVSKYQINHGEAVALGMFLAIKYSVEKGFCSTDCFKELKKCLASFIDLKSLCIEFKRLEVENIIKFMYNDKKAGMGSLNLILIKSFGKAFVFEEKEPEFLKIFFNKVKKECFI